MKYYLTGRQMQNADRYTIEQIGIPSMVLMERAALGVVEVMEKENLNLSKTLVVCGSGNNGGDGYAIARLLCIKGYKVTVYFVGDEEKRSPENRKQKEIATHYPIEVKQEIENEEYSVIIDAVFGTGLKREISGVYRTVIEQLNLMSGFKVAVDLPSGIQDETGIVMGVAFRADLTIALAYAKRGLVMQAEHPYVGTLRIADIGIYDDAVVTGEPLTYSYEWEDFQNQFPKRKADSHKGSYGKVLLIVGSKGMSGAALLSARAAYATGAGLVQIYTHEDNRIILQETLPEAIVTTYQTFDREQVLSLLARADVVGIGCGLGMSEVSKELVECTFRFANVPCVADADALNLIAKDLSVLALKKQPLILTPHMKEMTRLLGCTMQELQQQKVELLDSFVKTYDVTCVLKDARTLVAKENEAFYLNLTGNSAMAKGGSGDVLTGMIAGILAQKTKGYDAACLGVYLHGKSGDYAACQKGQYSVLAGDLVDACGEVLKNIEVTQ